MYGMDVNMQNSAKPALQALWIIFGLVCLAVSLSPVVDGDGMARYLDLLNLAKGERPIDKFSSIQIVLAMPLYQLGKLWGAPEVWVGYFNFIIFSLSLGSLWVLLPKDRRFPVIVLLMGASMLPHHVGYFYGEMLSVCATMVGLLCLVENKRVVAGILLGIGTAQTPALMPAFGLTLLYLAITRRNIFYGFYLAIPLLITLGDNWFKYGTPLFSAYLQASEHGAKTIMPYSGLPGFSYPLIFGLMSVFLSFGKGLAFFAPGLFFRWNLGKQSDDDRNFIRTIDVLLVFLIGMIFTYSRWWGWYGGQFWGPRYLLFASIPACFILAHQWTQTQWVLSRGVTYCAALAFSGWVCIQGYLYGNSGLAICGENKSALELLCWYVPEFSPLFRQFVIGFHTDHPIRLVYAGWCAVTVVGLIVALMLRRRITASSTETH